MSIVRRRGFSAVSALVGIPDPSLAWDVLVYRSEEERAREIRNAATFFRLELARQKGGSFEDVVAHLRSPSELEAIERRERELEEERIIAYFRQLSNHSTGVTISQNPS